MTEPIGIASISEIRLLARLAAVLRLFSGPRQVWRFADIVAAVGLSKATVHRLVHNLCAEELLQRAEDGSYHLGPLACALGAHAAGPGAIRARGTPVLRRLVALTGETAVMFQLSPAGNAVTCIEQIESPHGLRLVATVGERLPLHAGGASRAMLAFMPEDQIAAVVAALPPGEAARVRQQVARTRADGYTLSFQETNDGIGGIAAPVLNVAGQVIGSIAVVGPISRMDCGRMTGFARAVMDAAAEIGGPGRTTVPSRQAS